MWPGWPARAPRTSRRGSAITPATPWSTGTTWWYSEGLTMSEDIAQQVRDIALAAKQASRQLASASTARKNAVLARTAAELRGPAGDLVLKANELDMGHGEDLNLSAAMLDRLRLDRKRLDGIAADVESVMRLPDPVGLIE